MATVETLTTAAEYWTLPDLGQPTELVRGRIIPMNMPGFRHGEICVNVTLIVAGYVRQQGSGRVVSNDSGVQTEHDPDTVRGADVAYYSFDRLPQGSSPERYPQVSPEIVFEVRSPSDRWREIQAKVGEYLRAQVRVVCILDPETSSVHLYRDDQPPRTLSGDDKLTLPGVLDGFAVAVSEFFR